VAGGAIEELFVLIITGSEGNIGRRLKKAYPSAIGVDLKPGADIRADLATVSYSEGEFADALANATAVVHLATSANPEDPPSVHFAAVSNTARLVQACSEMRVPRLVLASSDWASPKDASLRINAYGFSKRAIEALARMYGEVPGLRGVALRIGWVPARPDQLLGAPQWLIDNYWSDAELCEQFRRALTA